MRFGKDVLAMDLYEVLGVPRDASPDHIRRAYRRLAMQSHPDLNPFDRLAAEQRMAAINVAAGVLLDAGRRAAYDRGRRSARRSKPPPGWWASPASGPAEWVEPSEAMRRATARATGEAQDLLLRLRPWPGRVLGTLFEHVSAWPAERHAAVLLACVVAAMSLVAEARPTSLPFFQQDNAAKIAQAE
jgi:curved DNA-binding protein CbpA